MAQRWRPRRCVFIFFGDDLQPNEAYDALAFFSFFSERLAIMPYMMSSSRLCFVYLELLHYVSWHGMGLARKKGEGRARE